MFERFSIHFLTNLATIAHNVSVVCDVASPLKSNL